MNPITSPLLRGVRLCIVCAAIVRLIGCAAAHAQDFDATFQEPTNTAAIATYALWAQPVNSTDPNQWRWLGQCNVGGTNISFSSSNCPANPCLLALTSENATNQSIFSTPLLFDTNNFNIVTAPWPLTPPTFLKIKRHK